MPKVTLLKESWDTYSIIFGKREFSFEGEKPVEVPVAVAIELGKKRKPDGSPLFKVAALPVIINSPRPEAIIASARKEQNVVGRPKQTMLGVESWR